MFDIKDLSLMNVGLASPDSIRQWSHGEVNKPFNIAEAIAAGNLAARKI